MNRTATLACLMACNCFIFPAPHPDFDGEEVEPDVPFDQVEFVLDPSCELEGELTVEIGQGEDDFVSMEDGQQPQIFTVGGFQGGSSSHYYVSVRVGNVDPERYDMLELELDTYQGGGCPDDGEPCGWSDRGTTMVLGGRRPWTVEEGSVIVESGMKMLYNDQVTTQIVVRDPCGREGWAQHRW